MMKKVKKKDLPKYAGGTISASKLDAAMAGKFNAPTNFSSSQKMATMDQHRRAISSPGGSGGSSGGGFGGFNAGAISAAGTWAGKELMGLAGIDDNSQAGVTLNSSMKGAELGGSIMPGWGHLIGGVAGAALGAFKQGSVDPNTGEVQMGGIFGRSKRSLYSEANRIKNSIQARERTLDIQMEYMNDPNVEIQPDVLAAEGGIMRKPVDALVSKGELIYNPENKKLTKVPGSKGKPNKKDDVYVRLYEGDVVVSNSPTMLMSNGKTPALNLERMVTVDKKKKDNNLSEGTTKAREAIIKKVVNWQEANKTKPQEYAMYGDGTGEDGVENKPIKKRRNSIWNRLQDKWNASAINDWLENYYNNIDKYEDHAIIDGRLFIKHDGKWYDSHKGGLGRALKGNVLPESGKGYMTDRYQTVPFKQGVFADVDKSKIVKQKKNNAAVSDIMKPNSNNGNTTSPELDFVSFRHVNSDYNVPESDIATNDINAATTELKKGTVGKPSSLPGSVVGSKIKKYPYNKNMSEFTYWDKDKNDYKKEYIDWVNGLTQKDVDDIFSGKYGDMSTYKGINKDYIPTVEEARQLMTDKKYGDWHKMSQSVMGQQKQKYGALKPGLSRVGHLATTPGIPTLKRPGLLVTADPEKQKKSINLDDTAYKFASIMTPLLDRAKAERVDYQVPIAKYRSTAVNVDPQLRSVDDSYAMARYNQENINPNTGAGMAYGLQAAVNRAKQRSDIYNWQTNAQNELIGKNVDTYNRWSENYANIMNNVYDKAAANRATARNINRQNRATALKNWGSILRNDKQYAMDRVRMEALDPMVKYGYQNDAKLKEMLQELIG